VQKLFARESGDPTIVHGEFIPMDRIENSVEVQQ
jgi:hypothetical protein